MLKKLILAGLILALVDPFLLYLVWSRLTTMQLVVLLIVFPFVIASLANRAARKNPSLGGISLSVVARLLVWYPGIISKAVSVLLIIPPVQALLVRWAAGRLMRAMTAGQVHIGGNFGGFPGSENAGPAAHTGGLKRADGRVVDDDAKFLPPREEP